LVVYIQEAHPEDGWQLEINVNEEVVYDQPETFDAREEVAQACAIGLDLKMPTLIDDMDNTTDLAYSALPDRLYLIGKDGRIAYNGAQGPMGFRPDDLEAAIKDYLSEN
jgi:type I thyroxine 5'-deiodinase